MFTAAPVVATSVCSRTVFPRPLCVRHVCAYASDTVRLYVFRKFFILELVERLGRAQFDVIICAQKSIISDYAYARGIFCRSRAKRLAEWLLFFSLKNHNRSANQCAYDNVNILLEALVGTESDNRTSDGC